VRKGAALGKGSSSNRSARKERPSRRCAAKSWCLYVLRCADGTLYCGITNDLARRIDQHNRGTGARYTRGRGPVALVRSWPAADRSGASKAEAAFKKLTRRQKEGRVGESRSEDDEPRSARIARNEKGRMTAGSMVKT